MSIYLDNAATTRPKPEVIGEMMPYLTLKWYNPSSLYSEANEIKRDIENARNTVGNFINADGNEIYFTSSGSEGNCWAIQGFVNKCIKKGVKPCIITSVIEHKSILECVKNLNNVDVHYIEVDNQGFINIGQLRNMLFHSTYICGEEVLVSIQFANNEIGTIQCMKDIANEAHRFDAILHTDAVQAFGQITIDVKELDIDMMTVSGHKIGTPKGVGFLYKKSGIDINPLIYGSQMDGMRGGTENVPYIIGLAKAVELCQVNFKNTIALMRDYIINQLEERFDCEINGSMINRLPNNISVTFPQNLTGEALIYMLDMSGIYISTGSACNSHSVQPSHVLKAIGLTNEEISKTIRISLSDEIDRKTADKIIDDMDKQIKLLTI